jgi:DNA-binding winged helix-turn-helix (wHTH) protein
MRFVFDNIVVDSEQVTITKHAKKLECEPRVFELLVYFCEHPKQAISREALIAKVWKGRTVSDAAVNRAVGELRKLLEDNPASPCLIKTVSKVGYRLAIIPTTLDSQSADKEKRQTTLVDGEQPEKLDTSTLALNQRPKRILKGRWIWLVVAFMLLVIFVYQVNKQRQKTETFEILASQPVTTTMGSAFNPFYHAKSNSLFYLYRSNIDAYAQLYLQKGSATGQAISEDDYYYTDVLYADDGFIYASRLTNLQQRHCEIVKIGLVTKRQSKIIDCGTGVVTQLVFDEKKRRLIYRSRPSISEPYALYSVQLETGRKQQLTHPEQIGNNTGDYVFAISPDSQTLAVVEYRGDDVDTIKLVDLNDNNIISRTPFMNNIYGMIWRSDNKFLVSNDDGLFEFDPDNLTLLSKKISDEFGHLTLGSNNKIVLTERSKITINIFSYSKDKGEKRALTASRGSSLSPLLGHRSNILAFKSNKTGKNEIYIQPEGQSAFIAEYENTIGYIAAMAWSPKDDLLVASIDNAIYLYSLEEKKWKAIAEHYTQVHHVTFVQDAIMFSAEVDGKWNLWKLSMDDGRVRQMTTKGGYSVQGNEKMVYFTKFNQDGLYQLDLMTGIESTLIEGFPIIGWRHWQLREDKIYYLLDKTYNELDLTTGVERVLHRFEGRKPFSCNMSYQHDFFACEQVELSTSNIWEFTLSH